MVYAVKFTRVELWALKRWVQVDHFGVRKSKPLLAAIDKIVQCPFDAPAEESTK